jgi:YYY domain-containing protein
MHNSSSAPENGAASWLNRLHVPRWRALWNRLGRLLSTNHAVRIALILILLMGAFFRFTGVNWDDQTHLHPDERFIWMVAMGLQLPRSIGQYFNTAASPLNPYNQNSSFVYGTLPLFLTKIVGELVNMGDGEHIHLVGRVLSASFDLITVYLMFLIGRKLWGPKVGLLTAFFTACLAINIQQAHFFTMDSFAATFLILTFYCMLGVTDRGEWRDYAAMGISFGLTLGCRINLGLFAPIIALAGAIRFYRLLQTPVPLHPVEAIAEPGQQTRRWELSFGGVRIALRFETDPPATGDCSVAGNPAPTLVSAPAAGVASPTAEVLSAPTLVMPHWLDVAQSVALRLAFAAVMGFLAFRIVQPYSFRGPGFFGIKFSEAWLKDMTQWQPILTGKADYFPSHQWASRAPIWFTFQNMVLWMVGLPLGIASWLAWGATWIEWVRSLLRLGLRKMPPALLDTILVLVWTTLTFLYHSTQFVKNSRYLLPFYPFMALLAAYGLQRLWRWARLTHFRWARPVALAAATVVAVGTLLYAVAFFQIYRRPLTRVAASLWVYDNIPAGSTIGWENWDDILPWGGVGGRNGYAEGIYQDVRFEPYHEDVPEKLEWFVDWTNRADYIILSSNRLYGSIPRLPMRYPMTTRYYEYLFSGELGFDVIETFTSRPNLGPIEFNDDNAEEAFTVYDHPKVTVLRKTAAYSTEKTRKLLGDGINWSTIARLKPIEVPSWKGGLQLTPEESKAQQSGGTWSGIFGRTSLSNSLPVVIWLLLVEILGLVTLPLANLLFHSLADRGYILSKTLGILLLAWLTWIVVSLGWTTYTRLTISLALLALTLVGGVLFWRRREEMVSFWKDRRSLIVVNELLFLAFFGLFLLIRWGNPDLWHSVMGGEKPMDFAYLNAVIKSTTFPPYDPWFAGGYLNYYYFGQIIVATLVKLTGIVPSVAYNLAIPLLASLTAMGAFCVVYNLTSRADAKEPFWRDPAVTWGLFAALLVAVLGNLAEIGVLFKTWIDMGSVDARSSVGLLNDLAKLVSGMARWWSSGKQLAMRPEWWYWNASRVMTNGEINEFPFFTFLYADLHAHLIALPFGLLILGLAVATIQQKSRPLIHWVGDARFDLGETLAAGWKRSGALVAQSMDWGEVVLLAAFGLAVGAMRPINSWDYPTYLIITGLALAVRQYGRRGRIDIRLVLAVGWRCLLVFVLSNLMFQPFLSRFSTAYMSIERWKGERTPLELYWVIHGLFLFLLVSWLATELFGRDATGGAARSLRVLLGQWDRLPRFLGLYNRLVMQGRDLDLPIAAAAGLSLGLMAWLLREGEWFYLFIVLLAAGVVIALLRWDMDPRRRFVWLLFGLGLAISLGVDLFVLKGDIGRMNTVFKFYLQLWVFWSVAAVFALHELADRIPRWTAGSRQVWWGAFVVLVALAGLYPIMASRGKIYDRFDASVGPTLDGMAYMKQAIYYDNGPLELKWDYEAINWMLDNVKGSPVIAEGNTEERGLYRWGSRVSIYTGLPTIIGWSWHQRQQRSAMPNEWVTDRLNDVSRLYNDPEPSAALDIIAKYGVRYIYVGDLERSYYGADGLAKFARMRADGQLALVHKNEHVDIYEVVQ